MRALFTLAAMALLNCGVKPDDATVMETVAEVCQLAPPSMVRSHVPPEPLAQTMRSSTALTPRRLA